MTSFIKTHKNLIPVIFLFCLCLVTAYNILFVKVEIDGMLFDGVFSFAHILALGAVIVNFILYFFSRKYFKYSIVATVLLGLFGVLNFTVDRYRFGIGPLTVQPLSLLVGIVYLAINYNRVKGDTADISTSAPDREKVDDFKQRYANQSIEELEALTDDIRYTKEARLAATELLAERVKGGVG